MTLTWDKGGTADVLACADDLVTLRSTIPSPPGSRIEGTLGAIKIKLKVHASKREDDGAFTIKGRLLDASREVRAHVAASTKTL